MYTPSVISVILCHLLHVFTNALVQFSQHDIKVQTFSYSYRNHSHWDHSRHVPTIFKKYIPVTFFPSVIIYSDFLLIHVEYHSKSVPLHLSPYVPTASQQNVKPLCAANYIFRILN